MGSQSFEELTPGEKKIHKFLVTPGFVIAGIAAYILAVGALLEFFVTGSLTFKQAVAHVALAFTINVVLLDFHSLPTKGLLRLDLKARHVLGLVALVLSFIAIWP